MAPPSGSTDELLGCLETSQEEENAVCFLSCLPLPGYHDDLPWRRICTWLDLIFLQAKSENIFAPKAEKGSPISWLGSYIYWEGMSGSKWEKGQVLRHKLCSFLDSPRLLTCPSLGYHATLGLGWNTGLPSMGSNILQSLEAKMKRPRVQESAPLKIKWDQ